MVGVAGVLDHEGGRGTRLELLESVFFEQSGAGADRGEAGGAAIAGGGKRLDEGGSEAGVGPGAEIGEAEGT